MSVPPLKHWQTSLETQINSMGQSEIELLAIISLCEETLREIEPSYVFIRDQRQSTQELVNQFRRLYLTRFKKEAPVVPAEALLDEMVLDSPESRKVAVIKAALDLADPGEEISDQDVLNMLKAEGKRFVADKPTSVVSTILNGFKSEFEKVEGKRGVFKRRPSPS